MISVPPSALPASNSHEIKAGTRFHRVHDQRFGSCSFNLGKGLSSSFTPLFLDSDPIPTQYLATDYECAVHETVFHDVPIDELNKTVCVDNIKPLTHSVIELKRDFLLVPLFAPHLAKWGVSRADLIDTTAADYHITAQWAFAAIHQSRSDTPGLIWTSKRCDPQQALVLFGDRVAETDLLEISNVLIYSDVGEMRQIVTFAARVDITLVL
ncbi:RES family NAD+ phosphorylase [Agrobacterium tumefaciens]|uniref:RES family NAD+ phosphorylase n=1 Tax=Agrobacterium tumefaciens TaxID=358 RepID=UPI000459A8BF|nr:RES family NAD+ phosphorylase [Agrobacterium tumefaciens]CDN96342.1 RES domain-containing protein [Agrobacterium tumefaciens]